MLNKTNHFKLPFLILSILFAFFFCLSCSESRDATLYRDVWGIPHIYAESEAVLAYAFGYAQAEDRLIQILTSYRYAEGTLSEAFGDQYVETDYIQKVWRHAEISQEKLSELSTDTQKILTYFIAGVKQYMAEHPEKVPDWAPEIHPWHIIAWGRTFIWGWPLDQALGDLRRGLRKQNPPHHSNQWVVGAERSAEGAPIALIDPHLSFGTNGHWYEARLHAGDFEVCGMCVVGTPAVGLGHNQQLSWAATTGGPDCGDVYVLDINPENSSQYQYDGEWRDITTEKLFIRARNKHGFTEYERTIERCHYGPIQARHGNKAYAIKLAYENEILFAEQMIEMNKAENLDDFKRALAMCQFMPQNIMAACVDGNIYYARTGRVPIRPDGFDWKRPVPGNTHKSEWKGIHRHDELVQITNPECGFMQNCNISPGTMMPNSPLTADKYPDYIYNDDQNHSNPRGRTALRLLGAEKKMTLERAKQITLDTSVDGFEIWQIALQTAFEANSSKYRDLAESVELIVNWNGRLDADNPAAALYRFWRRKCRELFVNFAVKDDGTLEIISEDDQKKMLIALKQAQNFLIQKFGSVRIPWGETVRLKRGDRTWPVSGGSFDDGISALRAAGGKFSEHTGITTITRGQSCCMIVLLKKPIRSFSILPWGESDDPESPHFADQAEKLFSKSQFKSTYFSKAELMQNLESQKEMIAPEL